MSEHHLFKITLHDGYYNYINEIKPNDLKLSEKLILLDKGEYDVKTIAYDIIEALFNRDFIGSGKHWCDDGTSCQEIKSEDPNIHMYDISHSSIWDWKDIYACSMSSAKIIINLSEKTIHIENYKFYTSG